MPVIISSLEREAAGHLLGHYRVDGYPRGGSFTTKFIEALEVADMTNTAKMLSGFPEFRFAHRVMTTQGAEALAAMLKDTK